VLVNTVGSEYSTAPAPGPVEQARLAGLMAGGLMWGLVAFCGSLAASRLYRWCLASACVSGCQHLQIDAAEERSATASSAFNNIYSRGRE